MEIKKGVVTTNTHEFNHRVPKYRSYTSFRNFYNELAIGRTTGFKSRKIAEKFHSLMCSSFYEYVVIKMKITGDIVEGTGADLSGLSIIDDGIVYAGKKILSFEKVEIA